MICFFGMDRHLSVWINLLNNKNICPDDENLGIAFFIYTAFVGCWLKLELTEKKTPTISTYTRIIILDNGPLRFIS